ncbi:hypothetical protein Dimus_028239 [Dionaea muscipula]
MAKRGRPRKRGGLARVVVSPRVAVNPRVVSRVVDRVEEVAIVDPADDSLKGVQLEEGIEVRHPSGRDELKSMGETKLPIELWGDDEGELVKNSVTVEADLGSPFLCALRRKPEEIETELRPLAGNRDMNRGTPLSRRSTRVGVDMHPGDRSPGSQGKAVIREDEWQLVRGRAASVSAYSSAQELQIQGESSGSRFSVLGEKSSDSVPVPSVEEIAAVVDKQLETVLSPFPAPIT